MRDAVVQGVVNAVLAAGCVALGLVTHGASRWLFAVGALLQGFCALIWWDIWRRRRARGAP